MLIRRRGLMALSAEGYLMLPSYLLFIYCLITIDVIFGLINIISYFEVDYNTKRGLNAFVMTYSLQWAAFHSFYEGIALFLLRYLAFVS